MSPLSKIDYYKEKRRGGESIMANTTKFMKFFTPKRTQILQVFLKLNRTWIYRSEFIHRVNCSHSTLTIFLDELCLRGVILYKKEGRETLYKLNRSNPLARSLSKIFNEVGSYL